ncbi:MAG: SigE family RNA polymerase sigma factor [Actinomycetota bacterium]
MTARDEKASRLAELYARHVPSATGFAYLLTGDHAEAEDLVHEAFIRTVGRFHHIRVPDAFGGYLRRTIVNLHTSRLRRLRLQRRYLERQGPSPSAEESDVAERQDLWTAIRRLPPRQRAVIVLRYYEDLSERAIAETLRCSPAAVKSLSARAMATLRSDLRGEPR